MKGYRLTVEAEYDLDGILDQGIDDYGIEAAIAYYDNLQRRFGELVEAPQLYPAVDDICVGYRRTVCGVHSVYYRIDQEDIIITRILKKQNPLKHLSR
ncbi:MAG: type II toxin-antitoxin system RelE/ParE family toxin [Pseudomonadota bacterium]